MEDFMLKPLVVLSVFMACSAFAQDMSKLEDYKNSYLELKDGSSRYIGKCSTRESYEKFYFKTSQILQKVVEPSEMSENQLQALVKKVDEKLMKMVISKLELDEIAGDKATMIDILRDYVDDISVDSITHAIFSDLNLIRFNVGVGGGNGGYIVFNQVKEGAQTSYRLMSFTFDSELRYCDRAVWLQNL
jgi:hypothetical protein